MSSSPIFYPNVTALPSTPSQAGVRRAEVEPGEAFSEVFDRAMDQVQEPLKFSAHASQRLRERKISLDPATMAKVRDAISKAEAKGVEDTLVLTPNAALIVSVKNKTVVTALDRNSLAGNIFTNIDGAVVV